jgi:formamidopyrimidine-DNA glycosylase
VPELAELELYRAAMGPVLQRTIADVDVADPHYLKRGLTPAQLASVLRGGQFSGIRRLGKLLLFRTSPNGHVVGVHLGMTGHLLLDGEDPADFELLPQHGRASWDRVAFLFGDGGDLRVRDRRRLGGVTLDPDLSSLGPDLLELSLSQLASALGTSRAPLKARLLDQSRVAGVGNLTADEALWRAGLDPARPAGTLTPTEVRTLHRSLLATATRSIAQGGSRSGAFAAMRHPGGRCPRDGTALERRQIGGRTTWFCPQHQR